MDIHLDRNVDRMGPFHVVALELRPWGHPTRLGLRRGYAMDDRSRSLGWWIRGVMAVELGGGGVGGAQILEASMAVGVGLVGGIGVRVVLGGTLGAAVSTAGLVEKLAFLCHPNAQPDRRCPSLPLPLPRPRLAASLHFPQQPRAGLDTFKLPSNTELALDEGDIGELLDLEPDLEERMFGDEVAELGPEAVARRGGGRGRCA